MTLGRGGGHTPGPRPSCGRVLSASSVLAFRVPQRRPAPGPPRPELLGDAHSNRPLPFPRVLPPFLLAVLGTTSQISSICSIFCFQENKKTSFRGGREGQVGGAVWTELASRRPPVTAAIGIMHLFGSEAHITFPSPFTLKDKERRKPSTIYR